MRPGAVLVGTTRRDGSARISEAEPLVMDGDLWLSMRRTSTRALDLAWDPRILVHSVITGPEPIAEIKVRGTAGAVADEEVQRRNAAAVAVQIGWQPVVGESTLFVIDIHDVAYASFDLRPGNRDAARRLLAGRRRIPPPGPDTNQPPLPCGGCSAGNPAITDSRLMQDVACYKQSTTLTT